MMTVELTLSAQLSAGLSSMLQARLVPTVELERCLESALAEGQAAWPGVSLSPHVFLSYLARRLPEDAPPQEPLRELCVTDLYLACACAQGDEAALAAFERSFFSDVQQVLSHRGVAPEQLEDLVHGIYLKLFSAAQGELPRITQYSGRGHLRSWVCVVAAHETADWRRRENREQPVDEQRLDFLLGPGMDPELEYLRTTYRQVFKSSFEEALLSLPSRTRQLLRYHLLHESSIDELASKYRVHRATAARWVNKARDRLITDAKRILMRRLQIRRADADSIIGCLGHNIDLSIARLFSLPEGLEEREARLEEGEEADDTLTGETAGDRATCCCSPDSQAPHRRSR